MAKKYFTTEADHQQGAGSGGADQPGEDSY